MPVIEFVWWSASEYFLADLDALFKPTIDYVSNAKGCLRIFSGLEEEDKTSFWMVVVWESHELHRAMMDRPDYPDMVDRLKPFFRDGQLKMNHVQFNDDTDPAFNAPVTAISFLALKGGRTNDNINTLLGAVQNLVDAGSGGQPGATWGQTHEDPGKVVFISGWDGVRAPDDVLQVGNNTERYRGIVASELQKTTDVERLHIKLRNHVERK